MIESFKLGTLMGYLPSCIKYEIKCLLYNSSNTKITVKMEIYILYILFKMVTFILQIFMLCRAIFIIIGINFMKKKIPFLKRDYMEKLVKIFLLCVFKIFLLSERSLIWKI